uniref:G_PROTEIN_RECEP_F1_2 domain-containing protein n=1 Tax=Panagrellus redivivus TaxID=6233 RepID=A0A7E4VW88_PANRE
MNETERLIVVATICLIFSAAFIFGFVGNLWVMISLYRSKLLCFMRQYSPVPLTPSERLRGFIFVLAMTDFAVILTVPWTLFNIVNQDWSFGEIFCKLHTSIDRGGKLFSVVILTVMSLQRYLVVCTRWRYTASTFLMTAVPIGIGTLLCVIIPIGWELYHTHIIVLSYGVNQNITVCLNVMPPEVNTWFVYYTFMCGFAAPLCIMAICYVMLVRHVRVKFRKRRGFNAVEVRRPQYMCELTKSIWRISIFHFTCWAPFWFFTALPVFAAHISMPIAENSWIRKATLFSNMLPYLNSSGNWILYAFLNRDVRHIIRRASSSGRNGFQTITVSFRTTTTS